MQCVKPGIVKQCVCVGWGVGVRVLLLLLCVCMCVCVCVQISSACVGYNQASKIVKQCVK